MRVSRRRDARFFWMKRMPSLLVRTGLWLLLVAASVSTSHGADDELARIERLATAGATELALKLVEQGQAQVQQPARWARWEQARMEMLLRAERWQALFDRAQQLPAGMPSQFLRWARAQQARAAMALGLGQAAVTILRRLIWSGDADSDRLADRRRALVQAYLSADLPADAATAAVRYEQDYAPSDPDWRRLRARVLLANDRPLEARQVLGGDAGIEAQALYLLAALRSAAIAPDEAVRQAQRLAKAEGTPRNVRAELWALIARAHDFKGEHEPQLRALAKAIAAGGASGVLAADGPQFWQALRSYGRSLGNRRQLLLGDDQDWLQAADALAADHPLQASALYAVLTDRAAGSNRAMAHRRLVALLEAEAEGAALLQAMYLVPDAPVRFQDLPTAVALRLADLALADSDFALASRLMSQVSEPPQGTDRWFWQLRRARILVLGGDYERGADALEQLLRDYDRRLSRDQLDRLMQVLFDLQRVGAHERTLALFALLPLPDRDLKLRREVLYWRADSHKALNQYVQAAQLYLESAWLPGADRADQWSQTAQYQAADALAQAGMTEDARRIYRRLLAFTNDPGRRAVLHSRLQQLSLSEGPHDGEALRN